MTGINSLLTCLLLQERRDQMAELLLPCYGGPYDGEFHPSSKRPIGYKDFNVRGKEIYLWKPIRIERIDFATLSRASRLKPSSFDEKQDKQHPDDSEGSCKHHEIPPNPQPNSNNPDISPNPPEFI